MAPYVTTLRLSRTWLTSTSNPLDSLVVGTARLSPPQITVPGSVRVMASGRKQGIVSSPAVMRTFPMNLRGINSSAVDWLHAHRSETILVRTRAGERFFARYFGYQPMPLHNAAGGAGFNPLTGSVLGVLYDVEIEFQEVTYVEVPSS